jgi:transposase
MPAERAEMRKVREILRLKHAHQMSERQISLTVGLSRSTVSEYLRRAATANLHWPLPEEVDDALLERRLFPPKCDTPVRPMPDWNAVHNELKRRGVTLMLLWEEYRAQHGEGYAYSPYCQLYRDWR